MLVRQVLIDVLAERVERAYRLQRPRWHGSCSTARVWAAAAATLWEAHDADPDLPLDPELYVAAQDGASHFPDPWLELTGPEPVRAYADRVASIVEALRDELRAEIELAEVRIGRGRAVSRVLRSRNRQISPLARYIVAIRAGRTALAERLSHEAAEQHRSCPLYRLASTVFLPDGVYPTLEPRTTTPVPTSRNRRIASQAFLN